MIRVFYTLIIAYLSMIGSVFGQSPEKMNYQAVIRNSANAVVTDSQVGMKISILQSTTSGDAVYTERQTPTTNSNGLVPIEIGDGSTNDDFSSINWAKGPYFIKTEIDPYGGTNYLITGISQLLSVPYALHAKTADNLSLTAEDGRKFTFKIDENDQLVGLSTPKVTLLNTDCNSSTYDNIWFVVNSDGGSPVTDNGVEYSITGDFNPGIQIASDSIGIDIFFVQNHPSEFDLSYESFYCRAYATNSIGTTYSRNILLSPPYPWYTVDGIEGDKHVSVNEENISYNIKSEISIPNYCTIKWSVPHGATITSGQGTDEINVNFGTSEGYVSASIKDWCREYFNESIYVHVDSIPETDPGTDPGTDPNYLDIWNNFCFIEGDKTIQSNANDVIYSIKNNSSYGIPNEISLTWLVPEGATIVSGQGTNEIKVNFGTSGGNIAIQASYGIYSLDKSISVEINSTPGTDPGTPPETSKAYLSFSGNQSIASWNTFAQIHEPIALGHELQGFQTSYYLATSDHNGIPSTAKVRCNGTAVNWPKLTQALADNGKTTEDLELSFGLMSMGDDQAGKDWMMEGMKETRIYKGGTFQLKLNGEDMIMGDIPDLTFTVVYGMGITGAVTTSIKAESASVLPIHAYSEPGPAEHIGMAFLEDCNNQSIRFVIDSLQLIPGGEFNEAGRMGMFFNLVNGSIQRGNSEEDSTGDEGGTTAGNDNSTDGENGTVTDIDGNTYKTVRIGEQEWMAENLKVTKYPDGRDILLVTNDREWENLSPNNPMGFQHIEENRIYEAYCYYNHDSASYAATYGALYTHTAAVNDTPNNGTDNVQGVCPNGWHLPSDDEWKILEKHLGMPQTDTDNTGWRGVDQGIKLKSTSGWDNNGNGTNDYGFSALASGCQEGYAGIRAYRWSSTTDYINDSI